MVSLEKIKKELLIYTIVYGFVMVLIVFLTRIPNFLINDNIINFYYKTNFNKNIIYDYLFIGVYLLIGIYIIKKFNIKSSMHQIFIIALVTIILTGGFMLYFQSKPKNYDTFFSVWFHTASYKSIIYDIILLVTTYLLYKFTKKELKLNKNLKLK
jgi:hypothetical protein